MKENLYKAQIQQAAVYISSTWPAPSAEPPAIVQWLAAQYADVFVRQSMNPGDGRVAIAEVWVTLRDRLLVEARRAAGRRSEEDWARASAEHGERVETAERELRRAMVAPCVAGLNRLTAAHVETLASVLDAGLPVEVALEQSARETAVAMLLASLGIPASAVDGATEVMRRVLREQAEGLVAARAG